MDRAVIVDHLSKAERHVAQGERHIVRQREIVFEIDARGGDSASARSLLRQFLRTQAMHVAGRDRVRAELDEFDRENVGSR